MFEFNFRNIGHAVWQHFFLVFNLGHWNILKTTMFNRTVVYEDMILLKVNGRQRTVTDDDDDIRRSTDDM